MTHRPLVVGDIYFLDDTARLKVTVSYGGLPVDSIAPTVTIVRDDDNYAADFLLSQFVASTPVTLVNPNFRTSMIPLGLGTYYYDFDPMAFGSLNNAAYTVIYRYDTAPYAFITEDEFTVKKAVSGEMGTGFGLLNKHLNVPLNMPTKISYLALSGQTDVKVSVYDPYGNLLVSGVTMQELSNSGVYQYLFTGRVDGEYTVIGWEDTNGSKDAMLLSIGGDPDRLRRIEQLLINCCNPNVPSVGPCDR